MSYSISGFAYAIIFVSFLYFWKRLFGYWRKERNLISKLWVLFDGGFVLYLLKNEELHELINVVERVVPLWQEHSPYQKAGAFAGIIDVKNEMKNMIDAV